MRRIVFLLVLTLPGLAKADSGCPILFQLGAPIAEVARACSTEGGLLVRQGQRWSCLNKEWRAATIFTFELTSKLEVRTAAFYPEVADHSAARSLTLNSLLDSITDCLRFEPEVLVVDPPRDAGASGLVFRWDLKNGTSVTAQELNLPYHSLLVELSPTTPVESR